MNIYYKLWVDCISRARSLPKNKYNWKFNSLLFMTLAMSFNLLILLTYVERHITSSNFYQIEFGFLPPFLNSFIAFLILYFIPLLLVNYFFIFRNDRYKLLEKKYKTFNGKLFLTYFTLSIIVPLALVWYGVIFHS